MFLIIVVLCSYVLQVMASDEEEQYHVVADIVNVVVLCLTIFSLAALCYIVCFYKKHVYHELQ